MFLYLLRKAQLSLQWIFFLENKTAKSIIFRTPYISWWILVIDTSPWNCWHPHGFVAAPWSHHGQELGFCFKLSFRDFRSCSVRSWTPESKKTADFSGGLSPKTGSISFKSAKPFALSRKHGQQRLTYDWAKLRVTMLHLDLMQRGKSWDVILIEQICINWMYINLNW